MKFRYDFEMMDMGTEVCAVPVGEGSEEFHGIIRFNESAAEMFKLIRECDSPDEALNKFMDSHPDEKKEEAGQEMCKMLNQLLEAGILILN